MYIALYISSHGFGHMTRCLSLIENILKNKVSELSVRPVLSENLHEETEQSKYFTTSFNNLTEEKLEALSSFDNSGIFISDSIFNPYTLYK